MDQLKWDLRFLRVAKEVATWSKDPSTKCGAVIVRPDRSVCSVGRNEFPDGMRGDPDRYSNRPMKYSRIIHAEMRAYGFANESVKGYTLYVYPRFCCDRCASHMIQYGIKRIVSTNEIEHRNRHEIELGLSYCRECGVDTQLVDLKEI